MGREVERVALSYDNRSKRLFLLVWRDQEREKR